MVSNEGFGGLLLMCLDRVGGKEMVFDEVSVCLCTSF